MVSSPKAWELKRDARKARVKERTELVQTRSSLKPGDYELGSLQSRAAARAFLDATLRRNLMIFSCEEEPLNLESSTCHRMLWPDGSLVEMVLLDGRASDLTDEQLEEFIHRFPMRDDS
jgi:hypothetical protein